MLEWRKCNQQSIALLTEKKLELSWSCVFSVKTA